MIGSLVATLWAAILVYVVAGLVATAILAIIVGGLIDHYTRRRQRATDDLEAVMNATREPSADDETRKHVLAMAAALKSAETYVSDVYGQVKGFYDEIGPPPTGREVNR